LKKSKFLKKNSKNLRFNLKKSPKTQSLLNKLRKLKLSLKKNKNS